jgi:xanthine dehydrogenase accessory factor
MRADAEQHWSEFVRDCESDGRAYVILTLLSARGSTPREAGTKMVIADDGTCGTLGGGRLEFLAEQRARELLGDAAHAQSVENFPLAEKLGQCCGGSVSVLFECFQATTLPVVLFGAGHVGRALAPILAALPLRVSWVDSRAREFPDQLPPGVTRILTEHPDEVVDAAAPGTAFIVMTHQHPLDYALMERVLRRGDASYLGVIGSASKWRRFRLRLEHRDFTPAQIDSVHCPIGQSSVPGKHPAEIAVSVAAQLIAHYHAARPHLSGQRSPGWKALCETLAVSGALAHLDGDREHE